MAKRTVSLVVHHRIWLWMILFAACLLAGCGHKSRLTPPEPRRLAQVTSAQADMTCGSILLEWAPTFFDTRGELLETPARYLVLRRRGGPVEKNTGTPTPSPDIEASSEISATATPTPPVTLDTMPAETTPRPDVLPAEYEYSLVAVVDGIDVKPTDPDWEKARITFEDNGVPSGPIVAASQRIFKVPRDFPPEAVSDSSAVETLVPGYTYYYQIVALGTDNVTSEPSYAIQVPWVNVPAAPTGLEAAVRQNEVQLTWTAPDVDCRGTPLPRVDFFEVHRTEDMEVSAAWQTLARVDDPDATEYSDTTVAIDTLYRYRIRAMLLPEGIPGEFTEPVTADTTDTFAPDVPMALTGAVSAGVVHLNWRQVSTPDLAGYNVYRQSDLDATDQLLNPEQPVRSNTFSDETVESGRTYIYSVTSVDKSPAANESGRSKTWSITLR